MLKKSSQDLKIKIADDAVKICDNSFDYVKSKILSILKDNPLTYFEYKKLIEKLEEISNNTPIAI